MNDFPSNLPLNVNFPNHGIQLSDGRVFRAGMRVIYRAISGVKLPGTLVAIDDFGPMPFFMVEVDEKAKLPEGEREYLRQRGVGGVALEILP